MFRVNDSLDHYVMTPVAQGYRKVTPSPVRTGVRNFFNNLRDVVSFGSNLLRLDIEKASTDFVRVGINSTFGLGGLIDIAGAGQIPDNKSTLGDTFASWGWKNSNYFVYPLTGPSTVRDSIGNTVLYAAPVQDAFIKNTGARWGSTALNAVQRRESLLDLTDSLDDAALDRYAYVRDVFMSMRNKQVGATQVDAADEDIDIDSLVPDGGGEDNSQSSDHPTHSVVRPADDNTNSVDEQDDPTSQSEAVDTTQDNDKKTTAAAGWTEEVVNEAHHMLNAAGH
ncbi:VacJ family lipoprotein [Snodgrassella sp. CFCC 13594]|uniref:MlaA family lipoprotein n=1 Tax=Snodgrassella sp. CFCC 13594 TaxID=1775559 RepID=UPI00082B6128